jgi:Sulfotransferase family
MIESLENAMAASAGISLRKKAPVFVLGCGRSGTTLLYHMLLSSGNFAVYRTESNVINLLEPRFGDLSAAVNKRRLLDAWYKTRLYTLSELEKGPLEERVMAECKNGGDFLRIIMEQMAGKQGVERWADTTPEHLLHLHRIKETIPNALIIHIIRDGRDVALSTDKQGYIRRLPWDKTPSVMVAGVYWEWMVNKGRRDGRDLGSDYTEVRFEDLVEQPQQTLAKLGSFIDHDLDYDRIQKVGIGSVSAPNTSFQEGSSESFHPAGRWKHNYPPENLAMFEGLVGGTLEELGYELGTKDRSLLVRANLKRMRLTYRTYFDSKLYLKAKTPLGKLLVTRDMSWI